MTDHALVNLGTRSLTKVKDLSNVIPFPKNRIVEKSTTDPKKDQKFLDELHRQQTKEFVETSVDDISLGLLKRLYDMAIKTEKPSFTKDLFNVSRCNERFNL